MMMCRVPLFVALVAAACAVAIISGTVAFVPLYQRALSSSTDTAKNFASEIASEVSVNVQGFLKTPVTIAAALERATRLTAMRKTDNQSVAEWIADFVRTNDGAMAIYYYEDASGFLGGRNVNTLNASIPGRDNTSLFGYYSAATQTAEFRYIPDNQPYQFNTMPYFTQASSFNHTKRPYYSIFRSAPVGSLVWTQTFLDYSQLFADVGVGGRIMKYDPVSGNQTGETLGIFAVFYRATVILDYFKQRTVAVTGRAFLFDATVNAYLGGTSNDVTVARTAAGTVRLAAPSDLKDPTTVRAIRALGNLLYSCTTSCSLTDGSGFDALFVTIIAIRDSNGLNLRVVVAVPAEDYLGPIRDSMVVSVGAATGAVVGLLILCSIFLHVLLAPLRRLESALIGSATLRDVELDTTEITRHRSNLAELYTLEGAYVRLILELKKVRSFLPQSVLRQLDADASTSSSAEESDDDRSGARGAVGDRPAVPPVICDVLVEAVNPMTKRTAAGGGGAAAAAGSDATTSADTAAVGFSQTNGSRERTHSSGEGSTQDTPDARPPSAGGAQAPAVSDKGTRRSHRNSGKGGELKPSGGPSIQQLQSKRVTVVMGNLCHFHKALQHLGPSELHSMHASVTKRILGIVNQNRGVLENFSGDRFSIGFNGSMNCSNPAERACDALLHITLALQGEDIRGYTGIRFGVSTGSALCGNFGPDALKRFCMIGSVVNHAYALALQTRIECMQNLVCHATAADASRLFLFQHADYVLLPQDATPSLISTIVERRIHATNSNAAATALMVMGSGGGSGSGGGGGGNGMSMIQPPTAAALVGVGGLGVASQNPFVAVSTGSHSTVMIAAQPNGSTSITAGSDKSASAAAADSMGIANFLGRQSSGSSNVAAAAVVGSNTPKQTSHFHVSNNGPTAANSVAVRLSFTPPDVVARVNEAFEALAAGDVLKARSIADLLPLENARGLLRVLNS